jgi:hypothetical protein
MSGMLGYTPVPLPRSRIGRAQSQAEECGGVRDENPIERFHMNILKSAAPLAILAGAMLVACSSDKTGDCPTMTGITDASVATVFKPGSAPDPSNVLFTLELTSVNGKCDMGKKERSADASLEVDFRATRPPSGAEAHYTFPYFVAVTEGSARILIKRIYSVAIAFQPGQTTVIVTDKIDSTHLEVDKGKHPYDYQILAGLQLTKPQLDYNRQHYGP